MVNTQENNEDATTAGVTTGAPAVSAGADAQDATARPAAETVATAAADAAGETASAEVAGPVKRAATRRATGKAAAAPASAADEDAAPDSGAASEAPAKAPAAKRTTRKAAAAKSDEPSEATPAKAEPAEGAADAAEPEVVAPEAAAPKAASARSTAAKAAAAKRAEAKAAAAQAAAEEEAAAAAAAVASEGSVVSATAAPDSTVSEDASTETQGEPKAEQASLDVPASKDAPAGEDAPAAEPKPLPDGLPLVLPLAEMTPEQRFRATTRLIFLAPDVPPVQPMPRRNELRKLDDILDSRFPGSESRDRNSRDRSDRGDRQLRSDRGDSDLRDPRFDRDSRDSRDNRDARDGRDARSDSDRGGRDAATARGRSTRRQGLPEHDEDESRRQQRQAPVITEPQKLRGSTRLEAKKQRRRDGRDAGRKRMVITESEFLARRESVDREMIVRTTADRIQIGVLEDKVLVEHYVARSSESSLIGNVYLGRVQNVLPSMEAAFVDIGRGRNAVLYSGEVDWSEFEGGNTARKIENALKPGDQVLVQVTKDPVGHKGARLTSQISLPGRFLVYVPGGAMNGISRKLPDTERARLKKILKEVLPSGAGVIVRTAAEGATEDQLTHDVQRLTRQWESIQARVKKGGGPAMLHSEPDMLIKIVRDVFNEDFLKMSIEGAETHQVIEDYLSAVAPDLMQRVERYEGERDIFDANRVTEQISKALDRKVWLPSGGSLVIDRTEAMTVVDVNTGKFVGAGGNLEETVTKNNLEAAEEIVRQLRLRDIGGIIVIDFIDMVLESNRDLVLRRLVECLGRDRTKHQVAEVTSLGLVQMTRKKLGLGLLESFSEPCDVCAGRGIIVHHEPVQRHRGDSGGRQKRSSGGNGGNGGGSNGHGGNSKAASEPKAQTHAITDGAKNMLAQVAASTIPAAKQAEETAPAAVLESVLDALPEAPPAGASTSRRRVSSRAGAPAGTQQQSAPQQPAAEKPAAENPAADKSAAEKPAAEKQAAEKPGTENSSAQLPAAQQDSLQEALGALSAERSAPSQGRSRGRATRAQSGTAPSSRAAAAANESGSADGGVSDAPAGDSARAGTDDRAGASREAAAGTPALDPERMLLEALDARIPGRGEA